MLHVSISEGNSKMGSIKSVSLPSIITCRDCKCREKCYAHKLERIRPNVAKAYQKNLRILSENPEQYWREVEAAIMTSRYFRFHVSGDIPNCEYFSNMVRIARNQSHCEVLCFTKKFEIVNSYIEQHGQLPSNLHMIFSGWIDFKLVNPFLLPEAHVRFKNGTTTARDDAIPCHGNCTECALTSGGCWSLQSGQQVIFDEH